MVVTDQAFATGADAVVAAENEENGDFAIYVNSTVNVGSLLFVDAPDTARSIARFANIVSLADPAGRLLRRRRFSLSPDRPGP